MNILFLYISLPNLSEQGVFTDLIKEFARQGHNVKVATPLNSDSKAGIYIEAGIEVLRFKTDQLTRNKSNIKKGLAYIKFTYQSLNAIRRHYGKENFDLIIAHSLPPEMALVVKRVKAIYKANFYLMLCEYIWQDAVSLGFFKENSLICKYYKWLENKIIKAADYIGSPSQGNIDFTAKYYPWVKNKNIKILHYSESLTRVEISKEAAREKYNLKGKFVAIYGGSMTIAQKIENVISLAESCIEYKDIIFILLGKGPGIERINDYVIQKKITNIRFIDFLPKKDYLELLSACDVGLISLNEKLAIPNIPSKTLSYFSLSIPVVASIDQNTDYGKYLEIAKAGLWSYAGDTGKFKENLLTLYKSETILNELGQNGLEFYLNNMLPEKAYNTIMDQIS